MTDKEAWDLARGLIVHEDTLINQRFTWLLVLNGFLFAAFGGGIGLLDKVSERIPIFLAWLGLFTLPLLGIVSGLTALNLLNTAYDQLDEIRSWWNKRKTEDLYPSLSGWQKKRYVLGIRPNSLVKLIICTWLILAVLLITGGLFHQPASNVQVPQNQEKKDRQFLNGSPVLKTGR